MKANSKRPAKYDLKEMLDEIAQDEGVLTQANKALSQSEISGMFTQKKRKAPNADSKHS